MAMTLDIAIKNIERTLPSIAFSDSWKCIKTHLSAQAKVRMDDAKAIAGLIQKGYALVPDNLSHIERMLWMGEYVAARLSQGATTESDLHVLMDRNAWRAAMIGLCIPLYEADVATPELAAEHLRKRLSQGAQGEAVAWRSKSYDPIFNGGYAWVFTCDPGSVTPHHEPLYTHPAERAAVPGGMVLVPREPTDWMVSKGTECHTCEQGDSYFRDTDLSDGDCIAIYKAMLAAAPQPPEGARVVDVKTPFDANPLARPIEDFLSGFRKRYSSSRGRGIKANAPMQDIVAPLAEAWNQYLLSWPQKLVAPTLAGKEKAG